MNRTLLTLISIALGAQLHAETVFFVVGPQGGKPSVGSSFTNSFLIPLSDPVEIADGRYLSSAVDNTSAVGHLPISRGDIRPLVRIRLGTDGTNRNVMVSDQPLWSWHVEKVVGWTDAFTPEYPYHDPEDLEREVVAGRIEDGFVVAFSGGYTVISELTDKLVLYIYQKPGSTRLLFYWTHGELEDWTAAPAQRKYLLEWTPKFDAPDSKVIGEDEPWVTRWSSRQIDIPAEVLGGGFFRLRYRPSASGP